MTLGVTTRKGQKGTFWCNGNILYFGLECTDLSKFMEPDT